MVCFAGTFLLQYEKKRVVLKLLIAECNYEVPIIRAHFNFETAFC